MTQARLPAVRYPFGPFQHLAMQIHDLVISGRCAAALSAADELERVVVGFGDERSVNFVLQARMYAYMDLGQPHDACAVGEELLRRHRAMSTPTSEAKILADLAEVQVKLGRLDEGLHCLARASAMLDGAPRSNPRFQSAVSSVGVAARNIELYELADECARFLSEQAGDLEAREVSERQRAEVLIEWALRLEQVGLTEEAQARFRQSADLLDGWMGANRPTGLPAEPPITRAMVAVCLAKLGELDRAIELATALVMPMREGNQHREAQFAHLAYGVALRARGDLRAARREFIAAEKLCTGPSQETYRLLYQYELAVLATVELTGEAAQAVLEALRSHARHLWRLRTDRKAMLEQARRRVQLEAEHATADRAATQDPLTGLGNRRAFDQAIAELDGDALAGSVALLLIDVDKFKAINDRFSHTVGDLVLREIGAVLRAHCRVNDIPVRFGGDEFALFIRGDVTTATHIGERIRELVSWRDWNDVALGLRVTLSLGAAELESGMTGCDLYKNADTRLYLAKRRGRDQLAA